MICLIHCDRRDIRKGRKCRTPNPFGLCLITYETQVQMHSNINTSIATLRSRLIHVDRIFRSLFSLIPGIEHRISQYTLSRMEKNRPSEKRHNPSNRIALPGAAMTQCVKCVCAPTLLLTKEEAAARFGQGKVTVEVTAALQHLFFKYVPKVYSGLQPLQQQSNVIMKQ